MFHQSGYVPLNSREKQYLAVSTFTCPHYHKRNQKHVKDATGDKKKKVPIFHFKDTGFGREANPILGLGWDVYVIHNIPRKKPH